MKARHLKVLGAICVAVNPETAAALISQKRIGHHAGMARQKVPAVIRDLEEFGYISRIKCRRSPCGRYKTNLYKIFYVPENTSHSTTKLIHSTHGDDMDRATYEGGNSASPPGVAESYLQESNRSSCFKLSEQEGDRRSSPDSPAGDMNQPRMQEDRAGALAQLAKARAETWERTETNKAIERLNAALSEASLSGEWLEQLSRDQLDVATDAERRKPGAGIKFIRTCMANQNRPR